MSEDKDNLPIPSDLVEEYAEIGADKLVEASKSFLPVLDPLGSEIPYVKSIIAAIKLPRTISDFLLGNKVHAFLYSSNLDEAKVEKFKEKFNHTKQERIWEQVVFAINAHDDKIKSEITGKLFKALVDEKISEEEFYTLVHVTNVININMLGELKNLYMLQGRTNLSSGMSYSFISNGLINIDNSQIGTWGGGGPTYPLNNLAWKYVGVIYDYPDSSLEGIKIGEGTLITELDENLKPTGFSYPFSYIQLKGSWYKIADIFQVRADGQMLCDDGGLPMVIDSEMPEAGQTPEFTAASMAAKYSKKPKSILLHKMEDENVQKLASLIKDDIARDNGTFRPVADINETINSIVSKTDNIRYLVKVVHEIKRFHSGDLSNQWETF